MARQLPLIVPRMRFLHPLVVKPGSKQSKSATSTVMLPASEYTTPTDCGKSDRSSLRQYVTPQTSTWNSKIPKPEKHSFTVKVELLKRGYLLIEVENFQVRNLLYQRAFANLVELEIGGDSGKR